MAQWETPSTCITLAHHSSHMTYPIHAHVSSLPCHCCTIKIATYNKHTCRCPRLFWCLELCRVSHLPTLLPCHFHAGRLRIVCSTLILLMYVYRLYINLYGYLEISSTQFVIFTKQHSHLYVMWAIICLFTTTAIHPT